MKQKVVAIVGPTGSHKSHIAIDLIQEITQPCQIIGVDAFQVYKQLNIGVNKPDHQMLTQVPHHFVNHIDLTQPWNISVFQKEAKQLLKQMQSQKVVPFLCGGSHLYVDALLRDYDLQKACGSNPSAFDQFSNQQLFERLQQLDSKEASKLSVNNRRRLIRAIEICESTGALKSELDNNLHEVYDVIYIICYRQQRERLYEKLDKRTKAMVDNGWINEVKQLLATYPNFVDLQAAKAIGYNYIAKQILCNGPIELTYLQKIIRNLAKRQLTWCKNRYQNNVIWFDNETDDFKQLVTVVKQFLK